MKATVYTVSVMDPQMCFGLPHLQRVLVSAQSGTQNKRLLTSVDMKTGTGWGTGICHPVQSMSGNIHRADGPPLMT